MLFWHACCKTRCDKWRHHYLIVAIPFHKMSRQTTLFNIIQSNKWTQLCQLLVFGSFYVMIYMIIVHPTVMPTNTIKHTRFSGTSVYHWFHNNRAYHIYAYIRVQTAIFSNFEIYLCMNFIFDHNVLLFCLKSCRIVWIRVLFF